MRIVVMVALSLLLLPATTLLSQDAQNFFSRGNVLQMEIYKDASNGSYLFTRLILALDPEDPISTNSPSDYLVVNCDANLGGISTNCLYTSAFLASSSCTPLRHETFTEPFLVQQPINKNATMDRYNCKTGAQRDAGECVEVGGELFIVFTQSTGNQVLWPWLTDVDWVSGCTDK